MKVLKSIVFGLSTLGLLTSSVSAYDSSYSLAIVGMNMDYKEYDVSGTLIDSEKSYQIGGIEASYSSIFERGRNTYSEWDVGAMIVGGDSDYVGSLLGSGNPYGSYKSTTFNMVYDLNLEYKKTYMYNGFDMIYGLGVGYHAWYRELSKSQKELYSWFWVAPTLGASFDMSKDVNIATLISYKYGINPTMSANNLTSDADLGGADIIELSIPVRYKYSNSLEYFAEFTLSKQMIDKSNLVSGYLNGTLYNNFYEPDSTAYNNYLKFGVTFKY